MVLVARKVTRRERGRRRGRADRVCLAGSDGILAQAATASETGNTEVMHTILARQKLVE